MNKTTILAIAVILLLVTSWDLTRTQTYRDHCTSQGQTLVTVRGGTIICK